MIMDFSSSFLFEEDSCAVLLNSFLQALENVLINILKLAEKFEQFLRVISSAPLLQRTDKLQNHTNNRKQHIGSNTVKDSVEQPSVSGLHEIAGLRNIKNILYNLVILPRRQPQLFQNRTISNSILLYGPPGTGKTRLVNGLAAESGAILHDISVGNILSKYLGETEKNIKQVFSHLRTSENVAILFIDEIDGLCRKRTRSEDEYSRRIKTELMQHMTKMDNCQNMMIIASTNCPWDLDSAILRRFQKRIYVPLPNDEERLELFQLLTKDINICFTPDRWRDLIQICEGYSGSDISVWINDALDIPLLELQSTTIWNRTTDGFYEPFTNDDPSIMTVNVDNVCLNELNCLPPFSVRARPVTFEDFLEASKNFLATVTAEDLMKYDKFKQC